eukprot:GGOE01062800.1.p2 GENE.GGOE01062800.1~~GGOE01062800.1.p2  ORF type:complete len:124 (+),score=0.68 GGOE01062800.1:100-471(+)
MTWRKRWSLLSRRTAGSRMRSGGEGTVQIFPMISPGGTNEMPTVFCWKSLLLPSPLPHSVHGIYTFHNIGFSKSVESGVRYLTCPDCEQDVLGLNVVADGEECFLCQDLVQLGGVSKPPISLS